ncbi:MAG: MMPL family transporter [Lentimicrobiaceae bacterium]|nr:MMPL family transporter [Lentimicrobiaceae bacterium]
MWARLAHFILRNRVSLLISLTVVTLCMAYFALQIEFSYNIVRPLPTSDPSLVAYDQFKKTFGEDGNVMVIGFQKPNLFQLQLFNDWYNLGDDIKKLDGIKDVLSLAKLYNIVRNDSLQRFDFVPIVSQKPVNQHQLDSICDVIYSLPFYDKLAYNRQTGATLMTVTFDNSKLNSKDRIKLVDKIKGLADAFGAKHELPMHYSGMPYIRTMYMEKVSSEMILFLWLAAGVTALILLIFFKSFRVVLYSMIVVAIGVIWTLGTIRLFGYQISVLTGLIAPLIVVIGLPNCIFLTNKYQEELRIHGNKMKALSRMVTKVGLSNFLANVTTAIGFGVFYFTRSKLLMEFGIVSAINVMTTYTIALVFITIILSYLPAPTLKHTGHLSGKRINFVINWIDYLVHHRRRTIYISLLVITIIAALGTFRIQLIGYVVDDLPKRDPVCMDLRFFEKNFNGVLPFEITVDASRKGGIFGNDARTLYKIKRLEREIAKYKEFSKPISIVEALKFGYQGYKGGDPKYFQLPALSELKKLSDYAGTVIGKESIFKSFIDSSKNVTRISYQMADVGSVHMKKTVRDLQPKVDSIFPPKDYKVTFTGHSLVFLKGNDYLYWHLFISLIIAIFLILLIGLVLFRSFSIIILSKIPCLVPLVITAGIMGYFGIPFKPSTILVFSIAFGIASDGTIYILTEYRNQLRKRKKMDFSKAVSNTVREVGLSMIYTAVVLFCGFAIFAASSFGGTVALGILISITLLVSMVTNLLVLPSILLSLEKRLNTKQFMKEPMLAMLEESEEENDNCKPNKKLSL